MTPQDTAPNAPHAQISVTTKVTYEQVFKYEYTQEVYARKIQKDTEIAREETQKFMGPVEGLEPPKDIPALNQKVMKDGKIAPLIPPRHGHFNVGIVGAGAAGLFTSLAIDWINNNIERYMGPGHLKIDYEILEAASEERFGGRLYTHRFSKDGTHDYYDVGAMRFPKNKVMERTFRLFDFLDIKEGELGERTSPTDWPVRVPYFLHDDDGVCPSYFNNVKKTGNAWNGTEIDPFNLNQGIKPDQQIPPHLTKANPATLFEQAIEGFLKDVHDRFRPKDEHGNIRARTPDEDDKLWTLLMNADKMSVRQFLLSYSTIQWLETATYGTGWYDQSLTEAVLEQLDFAEPEFHALQAGDKRPNYWWCIDGGAQKIAETMRKKMKDPSIIKYNTQVVGMDADVQLERTVRRKMQLNLKNTITGESLEPRQYFAVFNSTTLAAANRMDLSNAGLLWDTKQAIRCLGYGASCKVGIKFKTAWWRDTPLKITNGGVARTDLPLQVCVYPSYNIDNDIDPIEKPAVLLVSYTWGQTAQRIGALIASKSRNKRNEEILQEEVELKNLLLRDLAYLHAEDPKDPEDPNKLMDPKDPRYPKAQKKKFQKALDRITGEYIEHHAYDWYHDPHASGAFAYFGPCQFSELYPAIAKPNALGQLYFIGEAASSHHAWVVGALESVVRALWSMFNALHQASIAVDGKGYPAYKWAMDLLEKGSVNDPDDEEKYKIPPSSEPMPFYPLPSEMRERKKAGRKDDKKERVDHPVVGDSTKILMVGAALVTLSVVEYGLQYFWGEEAGKDKKKPGDDSQKPQASIEEHGDE
ncbi:putative bifunctional amine oxidase [Colletotrichum sp. SAR 10_66]|nr:putative bifunctional amine oxidase [Colletotrichum sp. SAR 10_76]KAJ5004875.1 putative bifunctional amine oxidase [Colletotrichum sp. SAR 10_66]